MASGTGTLAQYTVTSPTLVGKKPEAMSWQDSSSLPIALLTAFHNLITEGGLVKGAGQKVFIVSFRFLSLPVLRWSVS